MTRAERHHLTCRRCGRTAEVTGSALEGWLAAAGDQPGLSGITTAAALFGTCADCAASALAGPAPAPPEP